MGLQNLTPRYGSIQFPSRCQSSTQQCAESEMKMKKKITAKKLTGAKGKKANTSRNARSEEPISRRKEERSKSF